ncbi:MAG: tetratricopeptide repeat protein [Planctomycetota bacterium]
MSCFAQLLFAGLLCSTVQQEGEEPESFQMLFEQRASQGKSEEIVGLFRSRPFEVAYLFDGYLVTWAELEAKGEGLGSAAFEWARKVAKEADRLFGIKLHRQQILAAEGWSRKEQERFLLGRNAFSRGRAAQRLRKYKEAKAGYLEALETASALGDLLGGARAEQALGDLAVGGERLDEALERHEKARDLLSPFRHPDLLRSCRALAMIHESRGEFEQARDNLERMLAASEEAHLGTDTGPVREALVRVCHAMGDDEAAKKYGG